MKAMGLPEGFAKPRTEIPHYEVEAMKAMGLPEGFAKPRTEIPHYDNYSYKEDDTPKLKDRNKKEINKVYFCEICKIELNSQYTMESHAYGAKHKQKESLMSENGTNTACCSS